MLVLTNRQKKIQKELGLNPKRVSPKGWHITDCPYCGAKQKFGIIFTPKFLLSFNCFKCQEHGTGSALLKFLGLTSLLEGYTENLTSVDNPFLTIEENDVHEQLKNRHAPFGWIRQLDDPYLNTRGFEKWQYETYKVGRTESITSLKDYVIFLIEEDGENKGYIARHVWSKTQIEQYEKSTGKRILRYRNEGGVDFGKLLFGIDQITQITKQIIFVEGITDKFNLERLLKNLNITDTVVLCSFGKKLSLDQIHKAKTKSVSVESVLLLFDPDAVDASKKAGFLIESEWLNVSVYVSYHPERDPGDFSLEDWILVNATKKDTLSFSQKVVAKREINR